MTRSPIDDSDVPSLDALEADAEMWWPSDIKSEVAADSPGEVLQETFEQFREETVTAGSPAELVANFRTSDVGPLNLFLKHVLLLLDVSGERLQRLYRQRDTVFPDGELAVSYDGNGRTVDVDFDRALGNKNLCVDTASLSESIRRNGVYKSDGNEGNVDDVERALLLLCYGFYADSAEAASRLGSFHFVDFVGDADEFDRFARGRHIAVSRITKGSEAEASGRALQRYVRSHLENAIDDPDGVLRYRTDAKRETASGTVKSDVEVYNLSTDQLVSVEVSFQVTTNSTIERKGNEAPERYRRLDGSDNFAAYVVDGVGNFERSNAIGRIRDNCHYLGACSDDELDRLAAFVSRVLFT